MEQTLVLVKPDGVQRGLVGPIITRLENHGLKIVALKMLKMKEDLARRHYGEHVGKSFFQGLVNFITSGPIVAMVIEGPNAVEIVRNAMGNTNPAKSSPGTIRGDWGLDIGRNLIHGSDKTESAANEISLFFKKAEILSYKRDTDKWIIES
ncbi:MAG: nucleoside-diphosphate kinase [Dehalococcoidia bacterium]|nr:nucleoside-diphosphate kinase [Dehalococcoidia bacterium]